MHMDKEKKAKSEDRVNDVCVCMMLSESHASRKCSEEKKFKGGRSLHYGSAHHSIFAKMLFIILLAADKTAKLI